MADKNIEKSKQELIAEIDKRIADKIIEQTNADLLKKLINNAETLTEAIAIAELGTTYKRTGFHFDKRLEKMGDTIKYFKKNETLSFKTSNDAITHKLIIGDNYDSLLNLLIEYRGIIDVIYIDPPYGKDSMGEFADTNYENAITRDNLLSMLYPRLILARQLLSDNGIIFCSIDDKNQAYVKGLFDEIFEEKNFEGHIHWRRRHNQPNDKTKLIGLVAEHILVYAKNSFLLKKFGVGKLPLTGDFSNPDNDPRGDWNSKPWKVATGQSGSKYEITKPNGEIVSGEWMGEKATYESLLKDNRIVFPRNGNGEPRKKIFKYEREQEGQSATNWWQHDLFGSNQYATDELKNIFGVDNIFDNPKPTILLNRIIALGSIKKNAIILDFFAGSGTTGQALLELNKQDDGKRQFILATANEITETTPNGIVKDITSKRLKRVMTGKCYDGTDNFKWLENNNPLGDNLDVYDINEVAIFATTENKTPFDVIDETLYGQPKLHINDKIKWVCENFDGTQKYIENDSEYKKRIGSE